MDQWSLSLEQDVSQSVTAAEFLPDEDCKLLVSNCKSLSFENTFTS